MSALAIGAGTVGAVVLLVGIFVFAVRVFRPTGNERFKNALELTKAVALLIVAALTFIFIDLQRQSLSRSEHDLAVYQTFFDAANSADTRVKVRTLSVMGTYRQNFLTPNSKLDNTLVALSKSILEDDDVQAALAAPANERLAESLTNDRSGVIQNTVETLGNVLGDIGKLSNPQLEQWASRHQAFVDLPFPIQMGFADGALTRLRVHEKAAPFFAAVFQDIKQLGLQSSIRTVDGVWNPVLSKRTGALIAHVYGVAIDLNAATNEFGTAGDIDPRLVNAFKRHGFIWGGDWPGAERNPMHFEVSAEALAGTKSTAAGR